MANGRTRRRKRSVKRQYVTLVSASSRNSQNVPVFTAQFDTILASSRITTVLPGTNSWKQHGDCSSRRLRGVLQGHRTNICMSGLSSLFITDLPVCAASNRFRGSLSCCLQSRLATAQPPRIPSVPLPLGCLERFPNLVLARWGCRCGGTLEEPSGRCTGQWRREQG